MRPDSPLDGVGLEQMALLMVTHVHVTVPVQEMVEYLAPRCARLALLELPFDYAPDRRPRLTEYRRGKLVSRRTARTPTPAGPLGYIRDVLQTLWWGLRLGGRFDLAVAADNLNTTACLALRALGRTRRVVFYTIDYVPRRFPSRWLNWTYHAVDRLAVRRADVVWNLTEAVAAARAELGGIDPAGAAPQLVVPIGARITAPAADAATSRRIIFMGHLLEKQGVQVLLRAMPEISRRVPGARALIIGGGEHQPALERLAAALELGDLVQFTGRIEHLADVQAMMATGALGVAPYLREIDSWTRFADPGKIKNYLACGLPVLTTDVPPVAAVLERRGCALVLAAEPRAFAVAIAGLLLDQERLDQMRVAAAAVARDFEWETVIADALRRTAELVGR